MRIPWRAILWTGLIAGTMDATAAVIKFLAFGNREPIRIFWYIASAVLGREAAFGGGWATALLGLLFHYFIAYSWTAFYFVIHPRVPLLRRNTIVSGISYGVLVWSVMNLIVVPLTRIPPFELVPWKAALECCIIVCCIGLPIAISAQRTATRAGLVRTPHPG